MITVIVIMIIMIIMMILILRIMIIFIIVSSITITRGLNNGTTKHKTNIILV